MNVKSDMLSFLMVSMLLVSGCAGRHIASAAAPGARQQHPFCYRGENSYSEGAIVVDSRKTPDWQDDKALRCSNGAWVLQSETKYCAIRGLIYSQGAIVKKGGEFVRCDQGKWQLADLR